MACTIKLCACFTHVLETLTHYLVVGSYLVVNPSMILVPALSCFPRSLFLTMSRLVSHTGKRNITIRSSSRIADNKGPDTHCTPQAKPVKPPPTHTVHQIGIQLLSTTTAELPVEPMLVDDSVDYLNGPAEAAGTSVERYWSTLSFIGGAFRLDPNLFVLQDWDENLQTMKVSFVCSSQLFSVYSMTIKAWHLLAHHASSPWARRCRHLMHLPSLESKRIMHPSSHRL